MKKVILCERKLIDMFLECEAGRPASELLGILGIDSELVSRIKDNPKTAENQQIKAFREWVEKIYHSEELYDEANMEFNINENILWIMMPPFDDRVN
ncbi:hypothetical protein CLV59_104213 [Chitinophaga dinghuensis]|uniref:Uncharacterized protein n=1 Tax=Chitinophaga dinghuensis TaxID=1539050 RepID=A0A327W7I3_9BACT|nr:hypothetical protein [Chitinophaga dinghuensis]RAJ81988.1 hypothetical protein CLV59_104213 [Chitinophaga dinghuensis]